MKKVYSLLICFMFIFVMSFSALAAESSLQGFYVAPKAMLTIGSGNDFQVKDHFRYDANSTRLGGALAVGYDFKKSYDMPFRIEAEYALRGTEDFKVNGTHVKVWSPQTAMVNVYYDIYTGTPFKPYIGAGTGLAWTGNTRDTNWAWNVGAGIAYDFDENWAVDLGYRFLDFGKVHNRNYTGHVYNHEIMMGLRYTF